MKALVLSDTHVKKEEDLIALKRIIEPFLDGVDVIIHAGDSVTRLLVDYLKHLKPAQVVLGNMDSAELAYSLPDKVIVNLGRFKVGVTHGWGTAEGLKERIIESFKDDEVDAIIFGHSHRPLLEKVGNVLMLNPGSPTDSRFTDKNYVAILEADGELKAELIEV